MNFNTKVQTYINKLRLIDADEPLLVALSGGADSVCLLLTLLQSGYNCTAVHCNFHLRGDESNRDERFVRALCERYGVKLDVVHFDTKAYATELKIGIEEAARKLRYGHFYKYMRLNGMHTLCVGHHRDDSVETFLMNIMRGTGIKGLCGIQPIVIIEDGEEHFTIVRPLLCVSHEEIVQRLNELRERWVTDSTNLEQEATRNKIRLALIPEMQRINPAVTENMLTTIANLNEVCKVYEDCMQKAEADSDSLRIDYILNQPSPISYLHYLLAPKAFNRSQIHDVLRAMQMRATGKVFYTDTHSLLIDREVISVASRSDDDTMPQIAVEKYPVSQISITRDTSVAYLDSDKVKGQLTLRHPQPGDTFAPFGMHGKRKLVSDFLTNLKLSRFDKERQLLLCDGEEIVWVVGRRTSELYRVTKETMRVTVVKIVE